MKQLFISYSRKDTEFARQLTESFASQNMEAWVDWQDIPPSVDWMKEIEKGIEEADIFVFVVSPDSVRSSVCAEEVAHAIKNGKRIAPVIAREIDMKEAPATITHLNWIFFSRPQDKFEEAFEKLLTAVRTDYAWVQAHAQLQVKALEWERNNHEDSFLLRGKELADAEAQLLVNGEKSPRPTELQRGYVVKSTEMEKEQAERQRAKELQLEMEKNLGNRLRRLTYLLIGVFTIAYVFLFGWLNTVTSNLAVQSIKDQMLALVETSSCFFNAYGDDYQIFVEYFPASDNSVYEDYFYSDLVNLLDDIKATNKNIHTNIELYTITAGSSVKEYLIVVSTDADIAYKSAHTADTLQKVQVAGLLDTAVDTQATIVESGDKIISACSPVYNSKREPIGALCADFNAQLLDDTRARVTSTLAVAFLAVYPAMIALVLFVTRRAQKAKKSA